MRSTCATCGGDLPANSWALTICTETCFDMAADALVHDLGAPLATAGATTLEAFA